MERDTSTSAELDWPGLSAAAVLRRKELKLTQSELAVLAGVSHPTVIRLEHGDTGIRVGNALKILTQLGLVRG
jgi:predicted transcriptional regulator